MAQWFTCKMKFDKTMENGLIKKVTEAYLVDALSFTEAEKRFVDEMKPYMSGEFEVSGITKARIAELFDSSDGLADRWFKARVAFITLDEKTGAEKRARQTMMVKAIDFRDALKNLDNGMSGTLGEWVIESIAETNIMDVYPYEASDKEDEKPEFDPTNA